MPRPRSKVKKRVQMVHLRVPEKLWDELQRTAALRSSDSVSEVVRDALELLFPSSEGARAVRLSREISEALATMAVDLNRSPAKVAEDCVAAVRDSFLHNRTPLIVEELKLRRSYYDQKVAHLLSTESEG